MAITVALTLDRDNVKQASLIATADGDTTTGAQLWATLLGTAFALTPLFAIVTPVTAAGGLSGWAVTAISATGFTAIKSTTALSGAAPVQALLTFITSSAFLAGRAALGDINTDRALAAGF
jgi:hypothetical protein